VAPLAEKTLKNQIFKRFSFNTKAEKLH